MDWCSAFADIWASAFERQLQVALPTFALRLPLMSGLTASGRIVSVLNGRIQQYAGNRPTPLATGRLYILASPEGHDRVLARAAQGVILKVRISSAEPVRIRRDVFRDRMCFKRVEPEVPAIWIFCCQQPAQDSRENGRMTDAVLLQMIGPREQIAVRAHREEIGRAHV